MNWETRYPRFPNPRRSTETPKEENGTTMLDLTALEAEVTKTEGAEDSAVVLIQKLAAEIETNKANPAALQALADRLNAKAAALAAAVAANPGA